MLKAYKNRSLSFQEHDPKFQGHAPLFGGLTVRLNSISGIMHWAGLGDPCRNDNDSIRELARFFQDGMKTCHLESKSVSIPG